MAVRDMETPSRWWPRPRRFIPPSTRATSEMVELNLEGGVTHVYSVKAPTTPDHPAARALPSSVSPSSGPGSRSSIPERQAGHRDVHTKRPGVLVTRMRRTILDELESGPDWTLQLL
jgi:hypothetical protein